MLFSVSPTGDAPKGNGDMDCWQRAINGKLCRQRATRRKAMETYGRHYAKSPQHTVANGRRAERQWRRRLPAQSRHIHRVVANGRRAERQWRPRQTSPRPSRCSLSPTGDAPKGNGDCNLLHVISAKDTLSPTGDAPKGNGDTRTRSPAARVTVGRQRATRRKAMETSPNISDLITPS